jgi:hypothetical protein
MYNQFMNNSSNHHRKHIRENIVTLQKINPYEFGRFIMALNHLEHSDDWPRICGIHGNTFKPNDPAVLCPTDPLIVSKLAKTGEPFYCAHSVEPFITWHVPYLFEFEQLLNKYNHSNDKSFIALPYFDITDQNADYSFLNKKTIEVFYENKNIKINNPLASAVYYPNGVKTSIERNGYVQATTPNQIKQLATIRRQLFNTLHAKTYEEFSSQLVSMTKHYKPYSYVPLETPHNSIHDIIGGDGGNMSDISISAFDPLFWLHHCNMDRFFYNWLKNLGEHYDQTKVFTQKSLNATLAPFFPPFKYCSSHFAWQNNTNHFILLKEVLELIKEYPYTYESIPLKTKETQKAYVNIIDIPIPRESMTINVYFYPKTIVLSDVNKEDWYAGSVSWFGINRNNIHCERCERTRTNLKIDVLDFIREYKKNNLKDNPNDLSFYIEGKGKIIKDEMGKYKIYSIEDILQDGIIDINIDTIE